MPERMVDVVITIRATVPTFMLTHMFEQSTSIATENGIFNFEVDGSNVEVGGHDA